MTDGMMNAAACCNTGRMKEMKRSDRPLQTSLSAIMKRSDRPLQTSLSAIRTSLRNILLLAEINEWHDSPGDFVFLLKRQDCLSGMVALVLMAIREEAIRSGCAEDPSLQEQVEKSRFDILHPHDARQLREAGRPRVAKWIQEMAGRERDFVHRSWVEEVDRSEEPLAVSLEILRMELIRMMTATENRIWDIRLADSRSPAVVLEDRIGKYICLLSDMSQVRMAMGLVAIGMSRALDALNA